MLQSYRLLGTIRPFFTQLADYVTQAVRKLASNGFPAAMFGPAWTYQHFSACNGMSVAVDQAMWEGKILPDDLQCDCREGRPHQRDGYLSNGIITSAREFPVGSKRFFATDFRKPFEMVNNHGSSKVTLPQIPFEYH